MKYFQDNIIKLNIVNFIKINIMFNFLIFYKYNSYLVLYTRLQFKLYDMMIQIQNKESQTIPYIFYSYK